MSILAREVTLIRNTKTTDIDDFISVPFSGIINRIQNGMYGLDKITIDAHQKKSGDPEIYRNWKARVLPAVIPAGVWNVLKDDGKATHSYSGWSGKHTGFITMDFDNIEDVDSLIRKLTALPYIFFSFVSPSGKGRKTFTTVDPLPKDRDEHKVAWESVKNIIEDAVGADVSVDKQCKNINRLCYLAYDPDAYVNKDAKSFRWEMPIPKQYKGALSKPIRPEVAYSPEDQAREALKFISSDDRADWVNIGHALKHEGISFSIWDEWSRKSPNYNPSEDMLSRWNGFKPDGSITMGSVIHLAKMNGYKQQEKSQKFRVGSYRNFEYRSSYRSK